MRACGVWVPVGGFHVASCPRPAVMTWDAECPADPAHNRQVSTCLDHELVPGQIGCIVCLKDGREVGLKFSEAS